MTGTTRSTAGLEPRRKKALYRAWHRGTKEMDLVLGPYADAHIGDLSDADLAEFERLLDLPDVDMFGWFTNPERTPAEHATALVDHIRTFHLDGLGQTRP